jgi:hypothetical protein
VRSLASAHDEELTGPNAPAFAASQHWTSGPASTMAGAWLTYQSFTSAGPDDIETWYFGAPRTYGVQLNVNF